MFSNTAYEAFYTYIGLFLHEASIQIITSQKIFLGLMVIIFAGAFFFTAWRFFSRYLPGTIIRKNPVPLSTFAKIVFCLFLGISLLKVGSNISVKKFDRTSWHTNSYLQVKLPDLQERFEVSFVFDLLARSAEEVSRFATVVIDKLFGKVNSEASSPSFFYKSIMYAGADNIDDPELRDKLNFYVDECFSKVIPVISDEYKKGQIDPMFRRFPEVDVALSQIPIKLEQNEKLTCLDMKNEVVAHLLHYAEKKSGKIAPQNFEQVPTVNPIVRQNEFASQALVNFFWEKKEGFLGIHEGALTQGTAARIFQYWSRFWSWDGFLSLFGEKGKELQGASLAASRSQQFSEYLQRAPHLAGIAKMILIMIFPWLVFLVVAGRWRPLAAWYIVYFSVLMWTPLWTLFYHIMTSIAFSTEVLASFGKLSDGISLYSSELITSRLYQFYAIYSWIQLLSGPLPTAILAMKFFPWIKDSEQESSPEIVDDAVNVASVVGPAPVSAAANVVKYK